MNNRLSSPTARVIYFFAGFFFLLVLVAQHKAWRDPGSVFFDPSRAYDFQYSNVRLRQAYEYLAEAANQPFHRSPTISQEDVALCVGVASIARNGARYLRTTVASLLKGLTQDERDQIQLVIFIAETNASVHPAYQEKWLENLADDVLLYDISQEKLDHFQDLEEHNALVSEKMLFDYMYVMRACYDTGAPYIVLFEDDVLAMDGWFHRTMSGLRRAEEKSPTAGKRGDYLYMRLFYTEEFLGWNSEDLPTHIFWSLALVALVPASLFGLRTSTNLAKKHLTNRTILAVSCIYIPFLITLFFLTGRITTNPLPSGINVMNNYGCCAQGLAYPRHKAEDLLHWYDAEPRIGLRDSLIEQYADANDELRWALTPSVVQHIGRKTSKNGGGMAKKKIPITQRLWHFPFEMNDEEKLRNEHARVVGAAT
ncbi:hypothetical protein LTR37_017006 [Vermiconidia calcicola]|uniref:Uncharacterized protein n=1 Tax=Vermiconidia calcicola TaxID=1690605 RepID=A0ACC3ML70_9PEZI|nr:hypothetical protein LTR37_017006 [Vermiconidia calcicola]